MCIIYLVHLSDNSSGTTPDQVENLILTGQSIRTISNTMLNTDTEMDLTGHAAGYLLKSPNYPLLIADIALRGITFVLLFMQQIRYGRTIQ
ncbi:MAG TPA: hypothetical protein VFP20_06920 [Bacteroidales bacterium]|nr:hypothetical protein [Bacteroidales bacterium]